MSATTTTTGSRAIDYSQIPATLRQLNRWVLWREDAVHGKRPYTASAPNRSASSTDSSTWATYAEAMAAQALTNGDGYGIGFVLGSQAGAQFAGVDLDGCRDPETGAIEDWALTEVQLLDSYTEVSPSGTGLKVFVVGKLPGDSGKEVKFEGREHYGIEAYDHGRYFAVTGQRWAGSCAEVEPRDLQLADLYQRMISGEVGPSEYRVQAAYRDPEQQHLWVSTEGPALDVPAWCGRHGIRILRTKNTGGLTIYNIECQGSHGAYNKDDEAAWISQDAAGKLAAGCWHASCSMHEGTWRQLRDMFEPRVYPTESTQPAEAAEPVEPAVGETPTSTRPTFPYWVMEGTAIYEGLVKPDCEMNSRTPELMWMPGLVMQMNSLALRVNYAHRNIITNMTLGVIGLPGCHKSSSVNDIAGALKWAQLVRDYSSAGVTVGQPSEASYFMSSPGSPEGLLKALAVVEAKHAIVFYDELKDLVAKATIESSTMITKLLSMAENGPLASTTKKDDWTFAAGSYAFSLIWLTTEQMFEPLWLKLTGSSDGFNGRTFFLLAPEKLPAPRVRRDLSQADIRRAAALVAQRVTDAKLQGTYEVAGLNIWQRALDAGMSNRSLGMAEKLALGLAVDLGRNVVDEDCQLRGLALAQYRDLVYEYIKVDEAENKQAALQIRIVQALKRVGGQMPRRELERALSYQRYGSDVWLRALDGLMKTQRITLESVKTESGQTQCQVRVLESN